MLPLLMKTESENIIFWTGLIHHFLQLSGPDPGVPEIFLDTSCRMNLRLNKYMFISNLYLYFYMFLEYIIKQPKGGTGGGLS
jgi:hypothetical protein